MRKKFEFVKYIIILSSIFLLPTLTLGADEIIVPLPDAKKMVVNLEKSNIYEQQIILYDKANAQLTEQNVILLEQNKLLKDQLKIRQDQLDLTIKELDNQKQVYEDKIKIYEKEKGNIWTKVGLLLGGVGVGIITGVVLVLLL